MSWHYMSKYVVTDCTARHCRQVTLTISHPATNATVSNPGSFSTIDFHHSSSLKIDFGGADFLTRATHATPAAKGQVVSLAHPFTPTVLSKVLPTRRRCQPEASVLTWQLLASQIFFFFLTHPPPANHSLLITLMSARCS